MKTILILGGTGLVGRAALQQALADPRVGRVIAPTRRPLDAHPKLECFTVDHKNLPEDADWWRVDGAICALGTTMKKAGSRATFRRVDYDYTLAAATLTRSCGATAFALNSALGADSGSRFFYNRTKGEAEEAIRETGFPSLTIIRPGLLSGNRDEFRFAESVAIALLTLLGPLVPKRYRPVSAERAASALLEAVLEPQRGCRVLHAEEF